MSELSHPLIIVNGEPLDPPNNDLDLKEYWRCRKEAVLKDGKRRDDLERLLEVELFALPPGGSYQMEYKNWLQVSGGVTNPSRYMKERYGSAIICTRDEKGAVVFQKIDDEDVFHDYKEDVMEDAFKQNYKGAPVKVEIGDYWYVFGEKGMIKKFKIISFDKETMRYLIENQSINKRRIITRPVAEEGFLPYAVPLSSRGAPAYPYMHYFDRHWHAQQYHNMMWFRHFKIYAIFKSYENITNPEPLDEILKLTDTYIAEVQKIRVRIRAQLAETSRRRKELKAKQDEAKNWLN